MPLSPQSTDSTDGHRLSHPVSGTEPCGHDYHNLKGKDKSDEFKIP